MPSFRSICLLAITAFAALASASPVAGGVDQVAARSTGVEARAVDVVAVGASDLVVPKVAEHDALLEVRGGQLSLPDIVNICYQGVFDIQAQVNDLINAGGVISLDQITPFLTDINNVLEVALTAAQGLVGLSLQVILGTGLSVIGIVNLAGAVANLLISIVSILSAMIGAVAPDVAAQIVSMVTATICVTLVALLNLVLELVGTLAVTLLLELYPLLGIVTSVALNSCGLGAVASGLKL